MTPTILIIDDDPEVLVYLKELFQDHGYSALTASNAEEGLKLARAHRPHLITLDIDMPHKSGTLFYATLRQDETIRDIPVVVVSGVGPRPPALKKGVPVITKPINGAALLRTVEDLLA